MTPRFEDLFPELPTGVCDEARDNLDRYLMLVIRIEDRLAAEAEADDAVLTTANRFPTMNGERSNQTKYESG